MHKRKVGLIEYRRGVTAAPHSAVDIVDPLSGVHETLGSINGR